MTGIFDTHAHYDDERFDEDRDVLLQSLKEKGVDYVLSCGVNEETSKCNIGLHEKYPFLFAAAGFHPLNLEDAPTTEAELRAVLEPLLEHPATIALGEIGLDYYYEKESRNEQLWLFETQLKIAKERDLPVSVHDRDAHEDTLRLLKKYQPRGAVHCFSGSVEMAKEILKIGMHLGFGGSVTFKNAVKPPQVAAFVPLERLLLETDAPYMTPIPFRGKRCDSSHIAYTAEKIATLRGTTKEEIIKAATENAKKLFSIE